MIPINEIGTATVLEQLDRILASASFRNSRRHSGLLRFLVEETLAGRGATLKERTVAVRIFDLDPSYDAATNPVVRVAAGELRKRLAQYYHEPDREHDLRIEILPGSYVPHFQAPQQKADVVQPIVPAPSEAVPDPSASPAVSGATPIPPVSRRSAYITGLAVFLTLAGFTVWRAARVEDSFTQFWGPVWESPSTAVVSTQSKQLPDTGMRIPLADAIALARLAPILQSKSKNFRILNLNATTLNDLRNGPTVIVGAFSNELSIHLTSEARFYFSRDTPTSRSIRDRQNPANNQWIVDIERADADLPYTDYALITRVFSPETNHVVLVVGGIRSPGTMSAANFLTSSASIDAIVKKAPKRWETMNVQIVLSIAAQNQREFDPPKILTTYFW